MVYTVTLNPALDYVLRLNSIDTKDINRADTAEILYGGKGINVSVVLSRLGVDNKAMGFTAGFTGDEIDSMLTSDSIKTDFVKLKNGSTRINVKIFADRQIDINAPGPHITDEELNQLYKKLDMLTEGDILVLAGSVPSSVPDDIYERIMKRLINNSVRFVVDTTGDSLMRALPYKPFLIKPNHHELSELFDVDIKSSDDDLIVKYAKELQKLGAKNVLVSRGKSGATLVDENGVVNNTGIVKGKPVNNVGCGDSMVAGFIAGYEQKHSYKYALNLGSACGNASAFCEGLADKKSIMDVLNSHFSD